MALSHVSSSQGRESTTTTTHTITLPTGYSAGDICVIIFKQQSGVDEIVANPDGWIRKDTDLADYVMVMFEKQIVGDEDSTFEIETDSSIRSCFIADLFRDAEFGGIQTSFSDSGPLMGFFASGAGEDAIYVVAAVWGFGDASPSISSWPTDFSASQVNYANPALVISRAITPVRASAPGTGGFTQDGGGSDYVTMGYYITENIEIPAGTGNDPTLTLPNCIDTCTICPSTCCEIVKAWLSLELEITDDSAYSANCCPGFVVKDFHYGNEFTFYDECTGFPAVVEGYTDPVDGPPIGGGFNPPSTNITCEDDNYIYHLTTRVATHLYAGDLVITLSNDGSTPSITIRLTLEYQVERKSDGTYRGIVDQTYTFTLDDCYYGEMSFDSYETVFDPGFGTGITFPTPEPPPCNYAIVIRENE